MLLAELHGLTAAAPLYHFTPLGNFYRILKSNKLIPHARLGHDDVRKSISFTRDIRRSFLPGGVGEGVGLRFDRSKLASRYKLVPSTHNTMRKQISIGNKTMSSDEMQRRDRFESEERIYNREVDNVKQYITGVVIPQTGKWGQARAPHVMNLAMSILDMSGAFEERGKRFAKDVRDYFFKTLQTLNVPIVFQGKEFSLDEIGRAIGRIYWMKKNKPEEFSQMFSKFFHLAPSRRGEQQRSFIGNVSIGGGRGTYADLMGKGEL